MLLKSDPCVKTDLVVQWLEVLVSEFGGWSSIPGWQNFNRQTEGFSV